MEYLRIYSYIFISSEIGVIELCTFYNLEGKQEQLGGEARTTWRYQKEEHNGILNEAWIMQLKKNGR